MALLRGRIIFPRWMAAIAAAAPSIDLEIYILRATMPSGTADFWQGPGPLRPKSGRRVRVVVDFNMARLVARKILSNVDHGRGGGGCVF